MPFLVTAAHRHTVRLCGLSLCHLFWPVNASSIVFTSVCNCTCFCQPAASHTGRTSDRASVSAVCPHELIYSFVVVVRPSSPCSLPGLCRSVRHPLVQLIVSPTSAQLWTHYASSWLPCISRQPSPFASTLRRRRIWHATDRGSIPICPCPVEGNSIVRLLLCYPLSDFDSPTECCYLVLCSAKWRWSSVSTWRLLKIWKG